MSRKLRFVNFSVTMATAYKGNIIAFLTEPGLEDSIDTPAKIIESEIPIGMYNYQGSTTLAFESSKNPTYCEIWAKKEWITSFNEAFKQTIAGLKLCIVIIISTKTQL